MPPGHRRVDDHHVVTLDRCQLIQLHQLRNRHLCERAGLRIRVADGRHTALLGEDEIPLKGERSGIGTMTYEVERLHAASRNQVRYLRTAVNVQTPTILARQRRDSYSRSFGRDPAAVVGDDFDLRGQSARRPRSAPVGKEFQRATAGDHIECHASGVRSRRHSNLRQPDS